MKNKKYVNVSGSIFVFIICIIVMIISFILKLLANLIIFTDKRIKVKIRYNDIIKNNKDKMSKIISKNKNDIKVTNLDIINEIGLFNKSEYYEYFYTKIFNRGVEYFKQNKVKQIKYRNGMYNFIVSGTEDYNVTIAFNKDKSIDYMRCSCPFNNEKGKYCKHMVASILKLTTDYNIKRLEVHITNLIKDVDSKLNELEILYNKHKKIIKKYNDFDYNKFIIDMDNNLNSYKNFEVIDDDELITIASLLTEYSIKLDNHIDTLNKIINLNSLMKNETENEIKFYKSELSRKEKYIKKSVLFPIPIIYKNHSNLERISKMASNALEKEEYKEYKFNKQKEVFDEYFDE